MSKINLDNFTDDELRALKMEVEADLLAREVNKHFVDLSERPGVVETEPHIMTDQERDYVYGSLPDRCDDRDG